jgi:hemerythrin-like domain-containing protein
MESEILVKRVPELRDLSDDHHTGLVLARRCKRAGRPDSGLTLDAVWEQVVEAFSSHLEPHFRIEEQHLLPALEAIGEASLARRIREDHSALRTLRDSEAASGASIDRFGELLESHIRFEEREVFEATQDRLPAGALEAIAEACRANPRACPAFLDA